MASDSSVPAPQGQERPPSFSREETEAFVSYARSRVGEPHSDRMLEWCSSPEYRSRNVSMKRTRTLSKRAIREHIPEGVKSANFTETLDGCTPSCMDRVISVKLEGARTFHAR